MFDYIAYLTVQQKTASVARDALPDSPVQPIETEHRPEWPNRPVRHGISAGLRWLADRLEPPRECPTPAGSR